jgi:NAD(P)-dependent dehydrogenase (short-subunit alcohol dehydrogenase family)
MKFANEMKIHKTDIGGVMEKRLVLLTGGSRGIGKAIAERFISEGYEVIAPSREELDLSDDSSIDNFIEKYAETTFDVLINNAGRNKIAKL